MSIRNLNYLFALYYPGPPCADWWRVNESRGACSIEKLNFYYQECLAKIGLHHWFIIVSVKLKQEDEMGYLKSVLAGCAAYALASAVLAQGMSTSESSPPAGSSGSGMTSGASSSGASSDPFVDCRNRVAEARSAYQAGKMDKQEFEREKKVAQDKLKATGARGTAERNLECE